MPKLINQSVDRRWSFYDLAVGLFVLVLASLPYLQVAGFSFLNYDDPLHVTSQPAVLSGINTQSVEWAMTATPSNLWHPLTWMSYMAEVSWFGGGEDAASVHHLGNLALHLGATLFFYILLRTLRISQLIAAVVAVCFSLHPLHVEPVVWISSRKDVLYVFFAMASLCCYCVSKQERSRRWFWCTLLSFAAALASKPSAIVLPGLFVLLDYVSLKKGVASVPFLEQVRQQVAQKWVYFLLAGAAATTAVLSQYSGSHREFIGQEGLVSRLSYLPAAVAFYVQHTLFPQHLTFEYASPQGVRYGVLSLIGCACLLGLGYLWWRRRARVFLIGCLWFLVCLSPVLGVFYVGSGFTSDRYAYLALAGPTMAVALYLQRLTREYQRVALSVCVIVAGVYGVMSYQQALVWKDDAALFVYGVATEPRSGTAQTNLATLYRMQGDDDLALVHYEKALHLHASYFIIQYNRAQIYDSRGDSAQALMACRLSLRSNPHYARGHHYLAILLDKSSAGSEEAMIHFQRACQLEPTNVKFVLSHADAHARRRQYIQADQLLRGVIKNGKPSRKQREKINIRLEQLAGYIDR